MYSTPHASLQLLARYHVQAQSCDWRDAFLDLTAGRSLLLAIQPNGRERHLLRVAGVACIVAYDPHRALFITALPPHRRRSGG